MKKPVYATKGGGADWLATAGQLGYVAGPMPTPGRTQNVVSKELFETERIDVEIVETEHEH